MFWHWKDGDTINSGKTGTGLAEEKGQIKFLWGCKESVSLFSSRKIFLLSGALLRDPLLYFQTVLWPFAYWNCKMHLFWEILGILSWRRFGPRRLWCGIILSRIQESQKLVSLFKEFKARWGGWGKARTAVQLGQKLKHPRIEFKDINSSGPVALILKRWINTRGVARAGHWSRILRFCTQNVYHLVTQSVVCSPTNSGSYSKPSESESSCP